MDDLAAAASRQPYVNPWFESPMAARLLRDGVAGDDGCVEPSVLRRTEFYADILRPFDIFHSFGFLLENLDGAVSAVSVSRSHRAGSYSSSEFKLAKRLLPHLRNVHAIQKALADSSISGVNALQRAIWVLGGSGQVCGRTDLARSNASIATAMMERGGRLWPTHPRDRSPLAASIEQVLAGLPHARIPLRDKAGTPRYIAHIHHCRREAFLTWLLTDPPTAIVILNPLNCTAVDLEPMLRHLYGLTTAECRVAARLLELESIQLAAAALCRSEETVRCQLKAIFAKMGVNSQVRLLRLLYALTVD